MKREKTPLTHINVSCLFLPAERSTWQPRIGKTKLPPLANKRICHKLATSRRGPIQRMADFCGLQRIGILWQNR